MNRDEEIESARAATNAAQDDRRAAVTRLYELKVERAKTLSLDRAIDLAYDIHRLACVGEFCGWCSDERQPSARGRDYCTRGGGRLWIEAALSLYAEHGDAGVDAIAQTSHDRFVVLLSVLRALRHDLGEEPVRIDAVSVFGGP